MTFKNKNASYFTQKRTLKGEHKMDMLQLGMGFPE